MLTFLFWNTNRKPLVDSIAAMAEAESVDILILAECTASSAELLKALEDAFVLLDRISDTLHYEDGLPVTFLEARDIEIIYGDAVTELARFETLIREARGRR